MVWSKIETRYEIILGLVEHVDWKSNYDALRSKAGYRFPAYI